MNQQILFKTNQCDSLQSHADFFRLDANRKLDSKSKSLNGQFMTPELIASFMASLFHNVDKNISLLDPGAGVGSLTAGFVEELFKQKEKPETIEVDAFEIDGILIEYLNSTLKECHQKCKNFNIQFSGHILSKDFIQFGSDKLWGLGGLFEKQNKQYTHCIMNPPYKKIKSNSKHRSCLRSIGIETSNLYSAFLAIAIKMLGQNGELVAIVPRSFCNGVYFKPFRKILLEEMSLKHIHVFDSRKEMFKDDEVLQENIIFYGVKGGIQKEVIITSSCGTDFSNMTQRKVSFNKIVSPLDPDNTIHLAINDFDQMVADRMSFFVNSLTDLNLEVCTGPVVDFRLIKDITRLPIKGAFPLVYPSHFTDNFVIWPKIENRKPNAIKKTKENKHWLMPNGWFVLTKRFTSKEEKRRIVAAINDPNTIEGKMIGFENHLNVFHKDKHGLDPLLTKGLAIYLNSSLVDLYFRQFSGHTQVNATDLRMLRYPDLSTLNRLGEQVKSDFPSQDKIDELLEKEITKMTKEGSINPLKIKKKIKEALTILEELDLPKAQKNERSALILLALLDLKPNDKWKDSESPLMGITPIMDFSKDYYGKAYAPNTRETFRRQTMHQFVEAGLAVSNPDDPNRPINSPKWVYQIE